MPETVIRVHQLSKKFELGLPKTYKTLRDKLSDLLRSPSNLFRPQREYIWALRDISLEIKNGEFIGIVGRNGAGKSTLLKILARITEPTEGYAKIKGSTSSLLEVGTGFHPELTGRENIYLNGSILGMKRHEIRNTFDQIVDFSGVNKFIDTQVKHYSSGMRVRLAFSVAAHLRPDILFIDEVLAVGDLDFQQKCLQKMRDVTSEGRTVLLVSHNLAAIKEMSHKCILLNNGKLEFMGAVDEALARYSASILDDQEQSNSVSVWSGITIATRGGNALSSDEPMTAEAHLDLREDFVTGTIFFTIRDPADNLVVLEKVSLSQLGGPFSKGKHHIKIELPVLWLAAGVYVSRFRFVGHNARGDTKAMVAPYAIFTVAGAFRGLDHSSVLLHPRVHWERDSKSTLSNAVHLLDS